MQDILVLVVEDEALVRLELEGALHEGGYATESESSGEAAITKLEANLPIRALVTDINLIGERTGWDVGRRARELFPDLPVIYVTGAASEEWTSQGVPKKHPDPKAIRAIPDHHSHSPTVECRGYCASLK